MPWLLTAAGIAFVICLGCWPWPTLYTAGILAGARLLISGTRALLGERDRADASAPASTPPADGPLTGADTSSSNECAGCVGCGGPDCIERADGALADEQQQRDADTIAAIEERLAVARRMSCGHDATSRCPDCDDSERALRTELAGAYGELQLAVAHDRQPYPTAAAYTTVCAALALSRQAAADRADLLEEARDALEQAGQNGAHGDDWPAIAPAIRALAQQAGTAEAVTEVWRANAELAAGQRDQARATIARVETALDGLGPLAERHIQTALAAPVVQAEEEQPVSDPTQVDESDADSCQVVHVDGEPVILRGDGEMDERAAGFFAEVVQAAKRKYAAEHPDGPPTPRRTTRTFRRLAASLDGIVRDEHGDPICTCTIDARCAYCRATKSQAEADTDVQAEIAEHKAQTARVLGPNDGTRICACTPQGKCPTCRDLAGED